MSDYVDRPGYDRLWDYFGLSYASWLTMPRVLMHAMPDGWQDRMASLLEEYDAQWDFSRLDADYGTTVRVTVNGRLVKTPDWLLNYRHPDRRAIDAIRARGKAA